MKIDPLTHLGTRPLRRAERSGAASGGSFSRALGGDSRSVAPAAVGPPGVVDALLVVQEADDTAGGRAQARQRGEALLDLLEELRLALLLGRVPLERLKALAAHLAERRGPKGDPRIEQILAEIEVRAAVELAKLGY